MLTQIKLTNFKCFKPETTFPLSKFNLLTGVNGSGKSTLLQSLLLMRQSIEDDRYTTRLVLNGNCVNLGNFDDVRNREVSAAEPIYFEFGICNHALDSFFEGSIRYQLKPDGDDLSLHIPEIAIQQRGISKRDEALFPKAEKKLLGLRYIGNELYQMEGTPLLTGRLFRLIKLVPNHFGCQVDLNQTVNQIPGLTTSLIEDETPHCRYYTFADNGGYFGFNGKADGDNLNLEKIHFISADRIGPQEFYQKVALPKFPHLDAKGEFTVSLLNKMGEKGVAETLCLGEGSRTLMTQTEAWLGKILSPLTLKIPPSKTNLLELFIGDTKPANVGFGYSIVLPIIVSGLIAKPGERLIIENPEIHLHPKAQTALIQFLVAVAKTGVQVFVESHSDHVLDALRIAVLKKQLLPEEARVLCFTRDSEEQAEVITPTLDHDGRIDQWPEDFFDEMTKNLATLASVQRTRIKAPKAPVL